MITILYVLSAFVYIVISRIAYLKMYKKLDYSLDWYSYDNIFFLSLLTAIFWPIVLVSLIIIKIVVLVFNKIDEFCRYVAR